MSGTVLPGVRELFPDLFPKSTTTAKQGQQLDSVTAQQTGVVTSSVVPAYSSPGDYGSAENAVESSTVTSFCSLLFRQADGNVYAVPALRPAAWSHQSRAAGSYGVINDRKKYACAHCTKRFERPSSLANHMNSHTGARPHQCEFLGCFKTYATKSNMQRHLRTHYA